MVETETNSSVETQIDSFLSGFPILQHLGEALTSTNHLSGRRIGWHCHLTALTAATARVILRCRATLLLSECNPATTDLHAVKYMQELGAQVFLGEGAAEQVLSRQPEIISDTGFVLTEKYLNKTAVVNALLAASEITTSGVQKLRKHTGLDLPVINLNDSELKTKIENFHGVGDGVIAALNQLGLTNWSGKQAAVAGYGAVGAGIARYMKAAGAVVQVVDVDPVRRLAAHYDGFAPVTLKSALENCQLVITATGRHKLIAPDDLKGCRDGIILMNVGHWDDEIDVAALRQASSKTEELKENLEQFELGARRILLAGKAGPANVIMLSGSIEPTLIHLTTEVLTMNYLLSRGRGTLKNGENPLPKEVERQASLLALASLGLEI